jgi:hypothetical protein
MLRLVIFQLGFLVFCISGSLFAQVDSVGFQPGEVTILADSAIIKLERSTRRFKEVKGYRVQLFLGSLEEAKMERNKYLSLGLPYSAYIKQIVPEHALQIGDFSNRLELDKCLQEIEAYYPNAIAVVAAIENSKGASAAKSVTDKN